jgi:hypothetical protein
LASRSARKTNGFTRRVNNRFTKVFARRANSRFTKVFARRLSRSPRRLRISRRIRRLYRRLSSRRLARRSARRLVYHQNLAVAAVKYQQARWHYLQGLESVIN